MGEGSNPAEGGVGEGGGEALIVNRNRWSKSEWSFLGSKPKEESTSSNNESKLRFKVLINCLFSTESER